MKFKLELYSVSDCPCDVCNDPDPDCTDCNGSGHKTSVTDTRLVNLAELDALIDSADLVTDRLGWSQCNNFTLYAASTAKPYGYCREVKQ